VTKITTRFKSLDGALAFDAEVSQSDWWTGRTDRRKSGKGYGGDVYLAVEVPERAEIEFKEAIKRHGGVLAATAPT